MSDRVLVATMDVLEVENSPSLLVANAEDLVTINVVEEQHRTSGDQMLKDIMLLKALASL